MATVSEEKSSASDIGLHALIASGIASVIFAILAFCVLAIFIEGHFAYLDLVDEAAFGEFLYREAFQPENVERLQYMTALVVIPAVITGGCLALVSLLKRRPQIAKPACYAALGLGMVGIALLAYVDLRADGFYVTESALFRAAGPLSVIVASIVLAAVWLYERYGGRMKGAVGRWSGTAYWIGAVAMILPASFLFLTDRYGIEGRMQGGHLNAIMYPVAQVHAGKALLVDLTSQYGLYAQLLQPVFHVIGLDTFRFLLVMSAITCLAFVCLAAFIYGNVKSRFIAVTGLATVVYCSYVFARLITHDPYYQYMPVRVIFPALLILSGWLYFKTRNRWLYYGNFFLAAVSVLWNLDSGIVVAGAWLASLAYDEWASSGLAAAAKKFAGHLLRGMAVFALVIAGFTVYVYLVRGALPDYGMMMEYQSIFYMLGFYMIPMAWLHPWNLVGLVYAAGIAYAVLAKLAGKAGVRARAIFLLAILGAGVFSYYEGRSHDYNLMAVWYPAILILLLFADKLHARARAGLSAPGGRNRAIAFAGACANVVILMLLVSSTLSLALSAGEMADVIAAGSGAMREQPSGEMQERLAFILQNTEPGEEIYILSHDQAFYYAESGTVSAIKTPSAEEILDLDDVSVLCDYFNGPDNRAKVFLDSEYNIEARIIQALASNDRSACRAPGDLMLLYTPRTIN